MLRKLRNKKTAKKIWIVLALLIVPAFVLWGSGSLMRSKEEVTFAGKIFGKKISFLEYKDAFDAARTAAIMQFGDSLPEVQKYLNLESQAWDRLILLHEAKKRKIKVSDQEVIQAIESYPIFKRNGKFDNKIYSEIIRYVFRTQPRIFEEQTRQNLLLSKLYKQVTDGINLTDAQIRSEYQKLNEEISLYYIAGLPADFSKDLKPSEQEIKDYFAKHQLQFKQPLSFNIEYIALESEEKIKEVVAQLNKKADFSKVAKDLGITLKESGFFSQQDPIPGIGWSAEIIDLLAKLNPGQFSNPIQTDKNYYIIRLKERKEAYIPDFEKIKDKVKEAFIKEESEKLAKSKIESCLAKLKELYSQNPKSIDFQSCAKEFGLKFASTNDFKYGSYIEGIGASDTFWLASQKLKDNEFSEVLTAPSGFYIIKLKSRVPVDEKKFASEKAGFSQRLLAQKKEEYFSKFVEELSRKAGSRSIR